MKNYLEYLLLKDASFFFFFVCVCIYKKRKRGRRGRRRDAKNKFRKCVKI